MKYKSLLIYLLISKFICSQHSNKVDSRIDILVDYIGVVYEGLDFSDFIYIGINRQKLYYVKEDSLINIYDVSTALNGAGNALQSFKTPTGLHEISEKIGNDMPIGASFKYKNYTGEVLEILLDSSYNDSKSDAITTRILTLKGLEKGLNVGSYKFDTKNRGIYIHGTTEEGLIGKPASHGCIRMRNSEVIELFNAVNVGCKVVILDN
tara:strand:+ start:175 stop:798 length:624 start_codon:yes stop_codon:yes gene_type:complete